MFDEGTGIGNGSWYSELAVNITIYEIDVMETRKEGHTKSEVIEGREQQRKGEGDGGLRYYLEGQKDDNGDNLDKCVDFSGERGRKAVEAGGEINNESSK